MKFLHLFAAGCVLVRNLKISGMKTSQISVFAFFFVIAFGVYTSPTNDLLEITAHLCHFSPPKEKCFCSEEMEETTAFLQLYRENKT